LRAAPVGGFLDRGPRCEIIGALHLADRSCGHWHDLIGHSCRQSRAGFVFSPNQCTAINGSDFDQRTLQQFICTSVGRPTSHATTNSSKKAAELEQGQHGRKIMKWVYAILTFQIVLVAGQSVRADIISEVLGCEGDPCIVNYNAGGEIGAFKAAAREIKRSGRRVVINGACLSACAILADDARERVCVTSRAKFGFHKGFVLTQSAVGGPVYFVQRFTPHHSRDIAGWVRKQGGYPEHGFRVMSGHAARHIWRGC
jgi:hypothetical protein